jgi:hypothetical protein
MTFPNEIEKTKAEIKVLEAKLSLLEEMEKQPDMVLLNQGKVDIVYYQKRTFYRIEYTDSLSGMYRWYEKEKTFYNLMPIRDNSDIFGLLEELYQNQVIKQKEEYPYKKYTPEETEKSLKDAMKTAKAEGVFDKPKPESKKLSLKQLLNKWEFEFSTKWENPKNRNSKLYDEELERFIQMFTEWLPVASDFVYDSDYSVGWSDGFHDYRYTLMEKLK